MKKLLSLTLALLMLLSAAAVFSLSTAAAEGFKEGDVLCFKVENPAEWTQDAILYANFTDASRADNGDKSIVIAEADKTKYDPVQGVTFNAEKGVYQYTVTAADAGASAMRFWRGNAEKLWNCTVTVTAKDFADGKDTAVVTDWTDAGYLTSSAGDPVPTSPATEPPTTVEPITDRSFTAEVPNALFAHADLGSKDTEAWVKWYRVGDEYYFFLPSSVRQDSAVELFNTYSEEVTLDSVKIPAKGVAEFKPEPDKSYLFRQGKSSLHVKFMVSSAESALFVNNMEDFGGVDFFTYLQADKENSIAATGAVTNPDGTLTNAEVKKMKGRGNTSWNADKKGFNVTLTDNIELAGMSKCKKFSLISNFQDAAMARNRILYDMSDAVGLPYASDSRFIDLYTNGKYQGTYQMCEKIEVGKNTLMPDIKEDDYLDPETGGVKENFSFVAEIDPSPAADDFHFSVQNGSNITMKSPELEVGDPNIAAVRGYVKNKFNAMFNKLTANAPDLDDYIDLDSLAKIYLINELGKNWDSGAASFFLTFKPDQTGKYKFFASPVWDYDNSLGNARGVENDLRRMNVTDYTLPSGWWATLKGGYGGPNILATAAKQSVVMNEVYKIWFEDFLPAIDTLTSTGVDTGDLYSGDVYADIIRDSAAMNYKIWELVTDSSWICDHSAVRQYRATYTKNAYGQVTAVALTQDDKATSYDQYTYDGQFDYMIDWTTSRAAWISSQYIANYKPEIPVEPPTDPTVPEPTEPEVLPYPIPERSFGNVIAGWIFDDTEKTEGDKLTEYGSSDGYAATAGNGTLTMSVDGEKLRALEWSSVEYGPEGKSITPIMGAGKKNMWNEPFIQLSVPTKGYSDIKLTMYLAGSNKAPANWKLRYSTDGETFTDTGTEFTFSANKRKVLTAYLDQVTLPADAADCDALILQLVPVSMTTVAGGDALETNTDGEIAVNYIFVEATKTAPDEMLLGDVDGDGKVTILDATLIQRHLADLETSAYIEEAADADHDGFITILDATAIQRHLADLPAYEGIGKPVN